MTPKEQKACYRFLKSLLREYEAKLAAYLATGIDASDTRIAGEIAYQKNVISGLKLAIYRTGYKPLEESNGI